jgi:hypothetical protein
MFSNPSPAGLRVLDAASSYGSARTLFSAFFQRYATAPWPHQRYERDMYALHTHPHQVKLIRP